MWIKLKTDVFVKREQKLHKAGEVFEIADDSGNTCLVNGWAEQVDAPIVEAPAVEKKAPVKKRKKA